MRGQVSPGHLGSEGPVLRFPRLFGFAEKAFIVLSFCLFMGAATPLFVTDNQLTADARELLRLLFLPIYAATTLPLLPRARETLQIIKKNLHLAAPLFAACASVLWSIAPEVSARRCVGLLFTSLFGLYLCQRHSLRTVLRLLAVACGSIILLSYAVILLTPAIGINSEDQTWRGIFLQKNTLGSCVFLGILTFSLVKTVSTKQRVLRWVGLALAAVMLWFSGSRTPLVTLIALAPIVLLIRGFRFGAVAGVAFSLVVLTVVYVGAAFALLNAADALDLLGKDTTLTGRTELWAMAEAAIAERPWLGYGYGAFWEAPDGPSRAIWEIIGWDAPNAHNGYMDLLLSIGMVAPVVLLVTLCVNFKSVVGALKSGRTLEANWCMMVTFAMFLIAIDESALFFEQNSIFWILFVSATIYARRARGWRPAEPARRRYVDRRAMPSPDFAMPVGSRRR